MFGPRLPTSSRSGLIWDRCRSSGAVSKGSSTLNFDFIQKLILVRSLSTKKSSHMLTDRTLKIYLRRSTKPTWSVITAQMSRVCLSFIFLLFSPPDGLSFVSMLYSCVKRYQWSHFSRQIQACHGQSFGFHFKSGYFKANSLIFLRLNFSYFNPLNSHSIPFFSNLLSKDKNKVMLRCSLQDWHQFNGKPTAVCALKDMIQVSRPDSPLWIILSGILCLY